MNYDVSELSLWGNFDDAPSNFLKFLLANLKPYRWVQDWFTNQQLNNLLNSGLIFIKLWILIRILCVWELWNVIFEKKKDTKDWYV